MNRFSFNLILSKGASLVIVFILFFSFSTAASEGAALITHAKIETFWLWRFLGRLHPLIIHFPVSLLVIATMMELMTIKNYNSNLRPGIYILLLIGAISAIFSVLFGWLLADLESYAGETLTLHQWSGIATAILSVFTLIALSFINKNKTFIIVYRSLLFITVIGITITGHLGASITHGEHFLSSVTPWGEPNDETLPFGTIDIDLSTFPKGTDTLTPDEEIKLNLGVRTILAHHCYKCHSSDKMEGELRFDEKEFVFKGGESGLAVVPGDLNKSELFRRITLPAGHKEAMPGKGRPLSKSDTELIAFWIERGAPWPDQATPGVFAVATLEPRMPALPVATENLKNPVDLFVNEYFKENNVPLAWDIIVDDRTYLRRVYLDLIGLLPSPEDLQNFVNDHRGDKRTILVEHLLSQNNDYATHWLTFWNDLLRNDYTGTGYITNGRYSISDWLYQSLAHNKPYKQFVKELLDPNDASKGFIKGIQWRGVVNSSQSIPMQAAQNVSQALLGLNLKCASCHDSFISDWKLVDAYAFANAFSDESLEINRCDVPTGKFTDTKLLWEQLGEMSSKASKKEKAKHLAINLTKDENGRLYRTLVNRIWAQLMGRGIVAPVDEMDNAPWSQDLLDWLASDFVENGYDIKRLIHLITTSKTYQLPAVAIQDVNKINTADFQFAGMLRRKMTAEQFSDAVSSTIFPVYETNTLKYNPYSQLDLYKVHIPFARAALVENDDFLSAMGRPSRENVISSRESQSNLLQAMELTNGMKLNETLYKGAQRWLTTSNISEEIITSIYLKALGRKPNQKEYKVAKNMLGEQPQQSAVQDLLWAVVLLPEFQLIN